MSVTPPGSSSASSSGQGPVRDRTDEPLPAAAIAVGVAMIVLTSIGAAAISVLLIPNRIGGVLAPFGLVVAIITNVVLPALAWVMTRSKGAAAVPVVLFFLATWATTIAPGGDVLVAGGSALQTTISYATLLVGVVVGLVTVARLRR